MTLPKYKINDIVYLYFPPGVYRVRIENSYGVTNEQGEQRWCYSVIVDDGRSDPYDIRYVELMDWEETELSETLDPNDFLKDML